MKSIKFDSFDVKAIVTKKVAKKRNVIIEFFILVTLMKANHKFFKMDPIPKLSGAVVQRCSLKQGVLRNFTKLTGKQLSQSLFFNKVAGLRPATLLKRRFWHRCFSVNFVKFLRTPFYIEHFWWLLLGFTSNIFELHEPKTGGKRKVRYNFPDLPRLKLTKFS